MQGTGVFVDGPGAGKHIQAGAKKVIITAPAKGADIPTYVVGVNEHDYDHEVSDIIRFVACYSLGMWCQCSTTLVDKYGCVLQQCFLHHQLLGSLCEDFG